MSVKKKVRTKIHLVGNRSLDVYDSFLEICNEIEDKLYDNSLVHLDSFTFGYIALNPDKVLFVENMEDK